MRKPVATVCVVACRTCPIRGFCSCTQSDERRCMSYRSASDCSAQRNLLPEASLLSQVNSRASTTYSTCRRVNLAHGREEHLYALDTLVCCRLHMYCTSLYPTLDDAPSQTTLQRCTRPRGFWCFTHT